MKKNIVIVGYMGSTGAALIAEKRRDELLERFRPDYIEKIITGGNPISLNVTEGCEAVEVREGGVLKTLYELAESHRCGVRIELKRVPFLQSTIEICELYGLNPYRLLSAGYVVLCGDEDMQKLLEECERCGIPAACIGVTARGHDKVIIDKTSVQYIDKPSVDELLKIINR